MRKLGRVVVPLGAELLKRFGENFFNSESIVFKQPHPGAVWISHLSGSRKGQLCSMYFHPTNTHSAWTDGKLGKKKSTEAPCKWAISCQTRAWGRNKSGYDTAPH